MASLQADEDVPLDLVLTLRGFGHDVRTALESGVANFGLEDGLALETARAEGRIFLTMNRRHFRRLHRRGVEHPGVIAVSRTHPPSSAGFVHAILSTSGDLRNRFFVVRADGFQEIID